MLSSDDLSSAFGFLDVGDVPATARVSKDWGEALDSIEDSLWLSLVRKHHPVVEQITNMLPAGVIDEPLANEPSDQPPAKRSREDPDSAACAPTTGVTGTSIPPPSKNWKRQFQRTHMLARTAVPPAPSVPKPDPKPLSSYFFQVDAILKDGPGREVGVVSTIVEDASFKGDSIRLSVKGLTEISNYTFSTFDIKLTLFEKLSGKQFVIYNGGCDGEIGFNEWDFDFFRIFNNPLISDDISAPGDPCVCSMLYISKNGCICNCEAKGDWDLYSPPVGFCCRECACTCCSCDKEWECFFGMDIDFRVYFCDDADCSSFNQLQKLQFLERLEFA